MHEWAEKLLTVQNIDINIAKINEEIALVPQRLQDSEKLYETENLAYEAAKKKLQDAELANKSFENEITIQTEKKRDFQSKTILIKNNDEYKAALLHIEMCEKTIKHLEDQQLDQMFTIDGLKEELAERKKEVEQAQKRCNEVKEDIQITQVNLQNRLQELTQQREDAVKEVSEELMRKYTQIRSGRNHSQTQPCFVPLMDGACGRCRMQLPVQFHQDTVNGHEASCPNCAALLYAE